MVPEESKIKQAAHGKTRDITIPIPEALEIIWKP
jgi:hypothetical protein